MKRKKQRAGFDGRHHRARAIAGVDAAGIAQGTVGLAFFALIVWFLLPGHRPWLVLAGATIAWLALSVCIWSAGDNLHPVRKTRRSSHGMRKTSAFPETH